MIDPDYDQAIRLVPPASISGWWRATRHVPRAWADVRTGDMPEVLGGAEGYPAFVEATGRTAHEALGALYKQLGQGLLAVESRRLRKVELGQSPREIVRTLEVTLEEANAVVAALAGASAVLDSTVLTKLAVVRELMGFVEQANAQRMGTVP